MTPAAPQNQPLTLASVAAALSASLTRLRQSLGRPLDRYEIFAVMRDLAGARAWDAMPVAETVGAQRLIWSGDTPSPDGARYLLVTPEGHCYIEGETPADPVHAAAYLEIRRRFLAAHPSVEHPLPGSPEALQAKAAYDSMIDRIAEEIGGMLPEGAANTPTLH